jgi:hypothetical protein
MIGSGATSSAILFQGNDDTNTSICYPIASSGVYGLNITGSITDDGTGGLYDIALFYPGGALLAPLFSITTTPGGTFIFSGSYNASIPSGSSLCFVSDDGNDFFIQNFTASLSLVNTLTSPYTTEDMIITGSPIQMYEITGSTGGTMPNLFGLTQSFYTGTNVVNITQSWTGSTPSLLGPVGFEDSSQIEFFNGALSGSTIIVETGSLNDCDVEIIEIYTTSSVYGGTTLPFGINYSLRQAVQRDVDLDKTYYISFLAFNQVSSIASGSVRLYDNSGRTFYQGDNSTNPGQPAPGSSISVDQLQISNPVFPLYFSSATSVNNATINNIVLYESYLDPDCQVVANDVPLSRPNPNFYDVDFATNSITAVNGAVIISASRGTGSATPSTVPESNYTTARTIMLLQTYHRR